MKATAVVTAIAMLGAEATVVGKPSLRANDGAVVLSELTHDHHHRHHHRHHRSEPAPAPAKKEESRPMAHFGDTGCPCIGFDNIKGETIVQFEDQVQGSYPADLGARCEAWDDGHHPLCKEGEEPGIGNGWCAQKWCYVDSCNCDLPVLPKTSAYVPDATYRGKPVFYSYATCGGKNMWADEIPEVGTQGCRCIGFDNIPGTTDISLEDEDGDEKVVAYPAEIGGTCKAWDKDVHPLCRGKDAPKWCKQRWCYVDPCSCDLKDKPKVTMYLPEATFGGKSLYYSYETCNGEDYFTKKYNLEACQNQKTKDSCMELKLKTGANKCGWSGSACFGWEILSHPLCKKAIEGAAKSGTVAASNFAAAALVAIFVAHSSL
mmetsp:Transcript_2066/g.5873  ORF Transcript_2066/g.5873 Transcript_2066/m.5873 type:complete len:375 (+) Transcript_2066:86-1210(+)